MNNKAAAHTVKFVVTPEATWKGGLTVVPVPISAAGSTTQPDKRAGDILVVAGPDGQGQLRLSLGSEAKVSRGKIFKAAGSLGKWLYEHEVAEIGLHPADFEALGIEHSLRIFCDGLLLGAFRFKEYKSRVDKNVHTDVHLLAGENDLELEEMVRSSMASVAGANYARQVAHQPANIINPETLAERARALAAESGMRLTVLSDGELAEMGAGAILSVGLGSQTGSRLIILEYPGQGTQVGAPPVVVVGKAITFDTGGYSLKSTTSIVGMKYDKCGGAAVLGIMQAVNALQLDSPVVGMIAAAENMISEDAYRPNDIITTLSGQTVEVISTDAEGRLVLADALTYAHTQYQPRAVIDIATLTGGIVVSLGKVRAGLMSNNDDLAEALFAAGERTYERLWRMPLDDEYFELIEGYDSDFMNSSGKPQAHPVTGGIFLKQFVPDELPWAHLDIAGTASTGDAIQIALPFPPRGATGFGVRLVVDYLQNLT